VTSAFPPARGSRLAWGSIAKDVLVALEANFGARVVRADLQPEGFSPAVAAVVTFSNGFRAFVKALSVDANPDAPAIYRAEARVAGQLPRSVNAPRLLWSFDDGGSVALAFEHVDGGHPTLPWHKRELERVLDALANLARQLTPSPLQLPGIGEKMRLAFASWQAVADGGDEAVALVAGIEPWAARNAGGLASLERSWAAAAAGDTLVHGDVRADNVLLTAESVVFVDWPHAAIGAPWVDLVLFLPSVVMQGGPPAEDVFAGHPLGARAPGDSVTAVLCALTGFFLWGSLQPAPPGLPTLRAFQRGQGLAAAAWLRKRTGWP
jgi:Phosphotransferase enzyme family